MTHHHHHDSKLEVLNRLMSVMELEISKQQTNLNVLHQRKLYGLAHEQQGLIKGLQIAESFVETMLCATRLDKDNEVKKMVCTCAGYCEELNCHHIKPHKHDPNECDVKCEEPGGVTGAVCHEHKESVL